MSLPYAYHRSLDKYVRGENIHTTEEEVLLNFRKELIKTFSHPGTYRIDTRHSRGMDKNIEVLDELPDEFVENQHVIELGPSVLPMARKLMEKGAKSYTGVDVLEDRSYSNIDDPDVDREDISDVKNSKVIHGKDALSHLLEVPDESSIVISIGVMDPWMYSLTGGFEEEYALPYYKFLAKEMFRITPKGAVNMHFVSDKIGPAMELAGFTPVNPEYVLGNTIWRKPQ